MSCECEKFEGSQPEWCISSMISRVSDQNGVSLLYIMLGIHHSGREPSIYSRDTPFWLETLEMDELCRRERGCSAGREGTRFSRVRGAEERRQTILSQEVLEDSLVWLLLGHNSRT